jgi:hypothetical protein
MSLPRRACTTALALAAFAGPAQAVQLEPLNPLPEGSRRFDPLDAERTMAEFSSCLLDRGGRRERAERFLRLPPAGAEFERAGERLSAGECLPIRGGAYMEMRVRHDVLRAALFAALYKRDFERLPPSPQLSSLPPLRFADEFEGDVSLLPESVRVTRAIGDCAARADPGGAHRLLLTTIGEAEERRALDAVMPALANCLPEGQQLRFSRSMLRGILGEALYKLRRAAPQPSAAAS